jgi:hypothetical protein
MEGDPPKLSDKTQPRLHPSVILKILTAQFIEVGSISRVIIVSQCNPVKAQDLLSKSNFNFVT